MKKIILSVLTLCATHFAICQTFMHGAGVALLVGTSPGANTSFAEGFTYSPRFNFIETEKLSVSVGIPLTIGFSFSGYTNVYSDAASSFGFIATIPVIASLNIARGSTKSNRDKVGYFFGAGMSYYHGDFVVDNYYSDVVNGESVNTFGPAANAGVRLGVGRKHKNIEIRLSYMKGLSESKSVTLNYGKPNIYGIACLFNF